MVYLSFVDPVIKDGKVVISLAGVKYFIQILLVQKWTWRTFKIHLKFFKLKNKNNISFLNYACYNKSNCAGVYLCGQNNTIMPACPVNLWRVTWI